MLDVLFSSGYRLPHVYFCSLGSKSIVPGGIGRVNTAFPGSGENRKCYQIESVFNNDHSLQTRGYSRSCEDSSREL